MIELIGADLLSELLELKLKILRYLYLRFALISMLFVEGVGYFCLDFGCLTSLSGKL